MLLPFRLGIEKSPFLLKQFSSSPLNRLSRITGNQYTVRTERVSISSPYFACGYTVKEKDRRTTLALFIPSGLQLFVLYCLAKRHRDWQTENVSN